MTYHIEERFRQMTVQHVSVVPGRAEFQDPLAKSFQGVSLSRLIDDGLERFYQPDSENMITRVFRRFRRKAD